MIKKYFSTFLKTFFITTLIFMLIAVIVYRRADHTFGYAILSFLVLCISALISLSIRIFKSEKGNPIVNAVISFLVWIPVIVLINRQFGTPLSISITFLYLFIGGVAIVYAVAMYVASRKYKSEVNELNRLLLKKQNEEQESEEEE